MHIWHPVKEEIAKLSFNFNLNGIPNDKYDVRGIAHARADRKEDIFMQRWLVQSFIYMGLGADKFIF